MILKSPGAKNINLSFENFFLVNDAEMHIYNGDGRYHQGPIKPSKNRKRGVFSTDVVPGDEVIIELFEPEDGPVSTMRISRIGHGFLSPASGGFGSSPSCTIDVNCPLGNGWNSQSNSVAMVIRNNVRWCSGALVNNTSQDYKPYFLTAFHCVDGNYDGSISPMEQSIAENWVFRFNYESPSCGGPDDFSYITFNGADLRAKYQPADMALFELNESILNIPNLYLSGWNRSTSQALSSTNLSHPAGDVMKIAVDNDRPVSNPTRIPSFGQDIAANTHWEVQFDQGGVTGGSSGSLLFDQNKRAVGTLNATELATCGRLAYFGKLSLAWTGGGSNATRLSNWLDPTGSGNIVQDGIAVPFLSGGSNNCLPHGCTGVNYNVYNVPSGQTVVWSSSGNAVLCYSSAGTAYVAGNYIDGLGSVTASFSGVNLSSELQIGKFTSTQVSILGDYFLCAGETKTYNVSVNSPGVVTQYDWELQQGYPDIFIVGSDSNPYVYISAGPGFFGGILKVRVRNSCGGWSSFVDTTINPSSCYSTNTNLDQPKNITVFPNPVISHLQISFSENLSESGQVKVLILDQQGIVIDQLENISLNNDIDVSTFEPGVYFLNISMPENQNNQIIRFVKQSKL